jgi:hypothetical protein
MLSLGAAALATVALVPVTASAGHGHWGGGWHGGHGWHGHWHGGGWGWRGGRHWHGRWGRGWGWGGWGWGWGPGIYIGPRDGGCWAPGYGWVPCRRWWW